MFTLCGVFGEARDIGGTRDSDLEKVGVFGTGDNCGVFGDGNGAKVGILGRNSGVRKPQTQGVMAAVIGSSMGEAIGVIGLSDAQFLPLSLAIDETNPAVGPRGSKTGVLGASGSGAGVKGLSKSNAGLMGISVSGAGVEGHSGGRAGVMGLANDVPARPLSAVGVFGAAGSGPGVEGQSKAGPGVVCSSGVPPPGRVDATQDGIAQLRLVPSLDLRLPTQGHIGDLYLHSGGKRPNLYLCTAINPTKWQRVQLDQQPIAGGQPPP
jgi:hypothetical protein